MIPRVQPTFAAKQATYFFVSLQNFSLGAGVTDGSYYEENKANFLIYRNLPLTIIGTVYGQPDHFASVCHYDDFTVSVEVLAIHDTRPNYLVVPGPRYQVPEVSHSSPPTL